VSDHEKFDNFKLEELARGQFKPLTEFLRSWRDWNSTKMTPITCADEFQPFADALAAEVAKWSHEDHEQDEICPRCVIEKKYLGKL
jgi:hypothetical protein